MQITNPLTMDAFARPDYRPNREDAHRLHAALLIRFRAMPNPDGQRCPFATLELEHLLDAVAFGHFCGSAAEDDPDDEAAAVARLKVRTVIAAVVARALVNIRLVRGAPALPPPEVLVGRINHAWAEDGSLVTLQDRDGLPGARIPWVVAPGWAVLDQPHLTIDPWGWYWRELTGRADIPDLNIYGVSMVPGHAASAFQADAILTAASARFLALDTNVAYLTGEFADLRGSVLRSLTAAGDV